jgi:hypothetical protein
VDRPKEIRQGGGGTEVRSVSRDALGNEGDFLNAGVEEVACFLDDIRDGSAAGGSPSGGYDTIGAPLGAPTGHGDEGLVGEKPNGGVPGKEGVLFAEGEQGPRRPVQQGLDQAHSPKELVRPQYEIDMPCAIENGLAPALRHASGDAEDGAPVSFLYLGQSCEDLFLRFFSNGTGEEEKDVRVSLRIGFFPPLPAECPFQEFGVEFVHLAAEGDQGEADIGHGDRP